MSSATSIERSSGRPSARPPRRARDATASGPGTSSCWCRCSRATAAVVMAQTAVARTAGSSQPHHRRRGTVRLRALRDARAARPQGSRGRPSAAVRSGPRGARAREDARPAFDQGARVRPRDGEDVRRRTSTSWRAGCAPRAIALMKQLDAAAPDVPAAIEQELASRARACRDAAHSCALRHDERRRRGVLQALRQAPAARARRGVGDHRTIMTALRNLAFPAFLAAVLLAPTLLAQGPAMPDPKEIAGVPLPVGDVPAGTVTVRVIRGTLVQQHPWPDGRAVRATGLRRRQQTGESGRAEFTGLRPGARVKAVADVGWRTTRVAGDSPCPRRAAFESCSSRPIRKRPSVPTRTASWRLPLRRPAPSSSASSRDSSFELGDEALNVFNILQIVNTARTPVEPREPIVFESAAERRRRDAAATGRAPRQLPRGRRILIAGPFAPGPTLVQFAYAVPYSGPNVTIEQRMPAVLNQVTVMAQKVGEMELNSPNVAQRREMSAQGETYIVGQGPGVRAGDVVSFSFSRVAACARGGPATSPWRLRARFSLAGRGRACGHAARSPCRPIERVSRSDATGSSPSSPRLNSAAARGISIRLSTRSGVASSSPSSNRCTRRSTIDD